MHQKQFFFVLFISLFVIGGINQSSAWWFSPSGYTSSSYSSSSSSSSSSSTAFPHVSDIRTATAVGSMSTIRDRYFSISIAQPSNKYIKAEAGAEHITQLKNDGSIGVDANGNPIYKYSMTVEFYVLVYTAFPATYFQRVNTITRSVEWINVQECASFYTEKHDHKYYITYKDYVVDTRAVQAKPIGGVFSLPITASFNVPLAAVQASNPDWQVVGIQSQVIKLSTGSHAPVVGIVSSTDAKWTSGSVQSGQATGKTQDAYSSVWSSFSSHDQLAELMNTYQPGWQGEVNNHKVTVHQSNTVSMGTNVQLAANNRNPTTSLKGNYRINIGAHFYKYQSTVSIKHATVILDTVGHGAGNAKISNVYTRTYSRTTGFGVDNYFIKQPMVAQIDLLTTMKDLRAEQRPDVMQDVQPPASDDDISFDNDVTGDQSVTVTTRSDPFASWWAAYGIYVIVAAIGVAVVYVLIATPVGPMVLRGLEQRRR